MMQAGAMDPSPNPGKWQSRVGRDSKSLFDDQDRCVDTFCHFVCDMSKYMFDLTF
jgi:hypothetical protein